MSSAKADIIDTKRMLSSGKSLVSLDFVMIQSSTTVIVSPGRLVEGQ